MIAERNRFIAECKAIKLKSRIWGSGTTMVCTVSIGKTADVPSRLESGRDAWRQPAAEAVNALSTRVKAVRHIEGWESQAAEQYSTAVGVQIAGLEELLLNPSQWPTAPLPRAPADTGSGVTHDGDAGGRWSRGLRVRRAQHSVTL